MIDLRQSPNWAKYLRNIGWTVERIDNTNYAIRKLFWGSIIKIQRPDKINNGTILRISKEYNSFRTYIEPLTISDVNRFSRISSHQFLPTKTIQINLTKNEEYLLKEMSAKTRYNIRKNHNSKIKIQQSKNIEAFIDNWHKWHKKRLWFFSQAKEIRTLYEAFGKNANLLLTYKDNEIIAGLLIVNYDFISYYMYAWTSKIGKKLYAPTLLTWEAIKLAKKEGNKIFDFDGIYDKRFPIKSWLGFTKFKRGFGGKEVVYPGCFSVRITQ